METSLSIITSPRGRQSGVQRSEIVAAVVEVLAIFTIFIIAFTGRSTFGEGVKQFLTVLSVVAGALGSVAGIIIILRGLAHEVSRTPRLALGGFMAAIGIYTVVHVL